MNYSDRLSPSTRKKNQNNDHIVEITPLNVSGDLNDLLGSRGTERYFKPQTSTIDNQYEDYSHKISPIRNASPRDDDSKVLEMFYHSRDQEQPHEKQNLQKRDNYGLTQILSSKMDDKSIGNSYNSLLYFKTTDEGQRKMYNSYDYFDDLIKGSKTCKFMPLTKKQGK